MSLGQNTEEKGQGKMCLMDCFCLLINDNLRVTGKTYISVKILQDIVEGSTRLTYSGLNVS